MDSSSVSQSHPVVEGLAAHQGGVFTAAQARDAGYSTVEIRRLLTSGEWVSIRRGIYATRASIRLWKGPAGIVRFRVAAALLSRESRTAAGSHWTAASLHGLRRFGDPPYGITISDPSTPTQRQYGDVTVLRSSVPESHVTEVAGVRVTTIERTVIDIARRTTFLQGVIAADSALAMGADRQVMEQMCRDCAGWPGIPAAIRVVRFADARSDAVSESLARVAFAELGLPAPRPHATIRSRGAVIAEVDFLFEESDLIVEIDGKVKYVEEAGRPSKRDRLWKEKRRQERLEDLGYEVVRLTWAELVSERAQVDARIRRAMARAALRKTG